MKIMTMRKNIILIILILPFLFSSCKEEETVEPTQPFTSDWINIDPATSNITRVSFDVTSDALAVEMWGACVPDDCDWGVLETATAEAIDKKLELHWDHGFSTKDQTLEINEEGFLVVDTHTIFKDNSGRGDRSNVDIFKRLGSD
jgi:hypothetical protein